MRCTSTVLMMGMLWFAAIDVSAHEHDAMNHAQHMAAMSADKRESVHLPPPMRAQMLAGMRDHLEAVSGILKALAAGNYREAGRLADERLGMHSATADACHEETPAAPQMSLPVNGEPPMQAGMPEKMRMLGQEMHQAASIFAAQARRAEKTRDARPALAALANVSAQCIACHSAYRVE